MDLLLFTSQYPFDGGEAFVEDEINTIASLFDRVYVYSYAKSKKTIRVIPPNAKIIRTRDSVTLLNRIGAFLRLASPRTMLELQYMRRSLKQKVTLQKLHYIYLYYLESATIHKLLRYHDFSNDLCYSYWFGSRAFALSEIKKKHSEMRYVCRAHRVDSIPTNYNPFRREILANIDAMFPISDTARQEIEQTFSMTGLREKPPLHVLRLGIKKPDDAVNKLVQSDTFRIVTCSSIIQRKRLDLIIDAIAHIENAQVDWVHFGDGPDGAKMREYASNKFSQHKNITWAFKGNTNKNDILRYYADTPINVFINASDSEGVPVSIMEAFSYGIPCICRDVGGNSEIVRTGYNGELITGETSSDLVKAIIHLLDMGKEDTAQMRANAMETYVAQYNCDKNYVALRQRMSQIMQGD